MWYYNSQIIKTPKAMVISDVTYPRGIFRDAATLSSLGIKPYSEVTPDNRYYWNTYSNEIDDNRFKDITEIMD